MGGAPRRSGKRRLLRSLLVSGCIVVMLGVAEVLLRIINFAELRIPGDDAMYGYDAEIGWSLVPNSVMHSTSGNRTISVVTNSLGLRERELDDPRQGTFLFVGDSFTFGYDAELNERFTNLLQQELPQYRMVNAGVSGYGTDQQYLTLRRVWNRVKPQVVVLTICVDNDRDDNSSSLRWTHYKPYFARTPEGEWQVRGYPVPQPKRHLFTSSAWIEKSLLARFAILAYMQIRHAEIIVPDPTEHLISMMRRTAEARGARLVVGLQRHEAKLEAYLQAQKIPYTTFDEAQGYPTAGGHWTPEGNSVVAARYLALFAELGLASSVAQQSSEPADVRADQIADEITGQSRMSRPRGLLEITPSVLSPLIWLAAAQALPGELDSLRGYLKQWSIAVWDSGGVRRGTVALLALVVLGMATLVLWFWRQRRVTVAKGELTRPAKATSSMGVFLGLAVTAPLMLIAVTEALHVRMMEISYGLAAGVFVAAFGHAVAAGVLATDAPSRRLIGVDDETACTVARHLVCGAQALAVLVIALAVHRVLAAPPALTVATDMLYALVVSAILLHLLLSRRGAGGRAVGKLGPIVPWLHALGWLILAVIVIALLAGYARFAAFVAIRLVSVVAVLGALYLLLILASTLFADRLAADTPRHLLVGTDVGVTQSRIGLTSLCLCLGLILAALFLAIGPW